MYTYNYSDFYLIFLPVELDGKGINRLSKPTIWSSKEVQNRQKTASLLKSNKKVWGKNFTEQNMLELYLKKKSNLKVDKSAQMLAEISEN